MRKPEVKECFTPSGKHSHWELIDAETWEILWSEVVTRGVLIVGGGPTMKITELIGAQIRLMREMSGIPTEYRHQTASPEVVEALENAAVDFARSLHARPPMDTIDPFILIPRDSDEYFLTETKGPYGPSKNKVLNLNTKQHGKSNRNLRASGIRKIPRSRKSN